MKAEILANGTLKVTSETEIESFALGIWFDGMGKWESKYAIQIHRYEEDE